MCFHSLIERLVSLKEGRLDVYVTISNDKKVSSLTSYRSCCPHEVHVSVATATNVMCPLHRYAIASVHIDKCGLTSIRAENMKFVLRVATERRCNVVIKITNICPLRCLNVLSTFNLTALRFLEILCRKLTFFLKVVQEETSMSVQNGKECFPDKITSSYQYEGT